MVSAVAQVAFGVTYYERNIGPVAGLSCFTWSLDRQLFRVRMTSSMRYMSFFSLQNAISGFLR